MAKERLRWGSAAGPAGTRCPGAHLASGLLVWEAAEPGGARAVTPGVSSLALTGGGPRAAAFTSLGLTFFPSETG